MVQKKSNKTNLEKKSILFFEYGMVVAIATALAAFETGTEKSNESTVFAARSTEFIPEELVQLTRPELPKLLPPPVPIAFVEIPDDAPDVDDFEFVLPEIDPQDEFVYHVWEPGIEEPADPEIFVKVEEMPTYRGGSEAVFQKHLQQLVVYPIEAQELNIQGKVTLLFVVDEGGNLVQPEIMLSSHELLSNAVLEALGKTAKWTAGEQRGRKVKVKFVVPVYFRLQ